MNPKLLISIIVWLVASAIVFRKVSQMEVSTEDPNVNRFHVSEIIAISLVVGGGCSLIATFIMVFIKAGVGV